MSVTKTRATIEDLYAYDGKAELVNGEIVPIMTGIEPGYAGDEIYASLREYARRTGKGRAVGDGKGFRVYLPHRESFSPDAAYVEDKPMGMRFYEGAPTFAVEVRSEGDYGMSAEKEIAQKRADYFAAGTKVVWDVDLLSEAVVKKYVHHKPNEPQIFRRGETADAEPAVPNWNVSVDDLFMR